MIRKALAAFFEAWARQIAQAVKDWLDERDRLQAERDKTTAINDLEDARRDQENAARIDRAVDALRHDGAGGVREPPAGSEPDTRGYRD